MPDGRWLGWAEWGPSDGAVVLLCPGAATSASLGLDNGAVREAGVLLVSIDRPGLGESTHDPNKTLSSWADDVSHLIDREGWSSCSALGFSQGGPFALALANREAVSRAALVSAQDNLSDHVTALAPDVRDLLQAVTDGPDAVEASVRESMNADSFLALVHGMNEGADRTLYNRPAFAEAFASAVREGFSQGPDGYARDLVIALGHWPFSPEDIKIPVDVWYGELDSSPVHSPDHGLRLTDRLPRGQRHLVTGQGGSLLWTYGQEILAHLLDE